MDKLEEIADEIRLTFDNLNKSRDMALSQSRMLIRHCSKAIRAVHREDTDVMNDHLEKAGELAKMLTKGLENYPSLYHTGYTQDALKEYAEAKITCALILNEPLPSPEEINVIQATWLKGLSEVVGELRRRSLDLLRQSNSSEAERLLNLMDEIYSVLVTMDYPDAITYGLRRQTDIARSIIERTRGDLTFSLQGESLASAISDLSQQLLQKDDHSNEPQLQ
ncbi:haloacid dehalogenase [Chloroflexota bacterium]